MNLRLLPVAALLPLAVSLGSAAESAQTPRVLTVTAQETVSIPSTHARVAVMIEARERTPDAASAGVGVASQRVLEHLRGASVARLQTGGLALNPVFAPRRGASSIDGRVETEITGYLAQWTASFEVPVERAGQLVAQVLDRGVTRIVDFSLTATPEAAAAAQQEALKLAAQRARADAAAVLGALGYTPGDVLKVHVHPGGTVLPMQRAGVAMAYAEKGAPAIEGGTQDVTGQVTLEVGY